MFSFSSHATNATMFSCFRVCVAYLESIDDLVFQGWFAWTVGLHPSSLRLTILDCARFVAIKADAQTATKKMQMELAPKQRLG